MHVGPEDVLAYAEVPVRGLKEQTSTTLTANMEGEVLGQT